MKTGGVGVGCFLLVLLFNVLIGAMSVNYLLEAWIGKDIPWYADALIGLILAEITVPAAIVTWLLRYFGAL